MIQFILDLFIYSLNWLSFFILSVTFSLIYLLTLPRYNLRKIKSAALILSLLILNINLLFLSSYDYTKVGIQFQNLYKKDIFLYEFNFQVGIDNLSLWFIILTTLLFPFCIMISWNSIKTKVKEFYVLLFVLEFLLILSFIVFDLLFFYILFELILLPTFLIIGIWGSRQRKIHAAYQLFLYTVVGSVLMFTNIILINSMCSTTNILYLYNDSFFLQSDYQYLIWFSFFLSFAIKIPMLPFHIWLPEAHVEAPTAGSVLLAGILLKLGTYAMLRFLIPLIPFATGYFTPFVYTICIISIVYASCTTIRQIDLKKIIAYSSVAHMNFALLGLYSNTVEGLTGSLYIMLGHGVISSALFLCIGIVYDRYHTRNILYYGGLIFTMPLFSTCFFLFTLGNIGFPGTVNFVGELLVLLGVYKNNIFVAFLGSLGIFLGIIYSIWLYNRMIFGKLKKNILFKFKDLNLREFSLLVPFIVLMFIMGIYPQFITESLNSLSSLYVYLNIPSHTNSEIVPSHWYNYSYLSQDPFLILKEFLENRFGGCFNDFDWIPMEVFSVDNVDGDITGENITNEDIKNFPPSNDKLNHKVIEGKTPEEWKDVYREEMEHTNNLIKNFLEEETVLLSREYMNENRFEWDIERDCYIRQYEDNWIDDVWERKVCFLSKADAENILLKWENNEPYFPGENWTPKDRYIYMAQARNVLIIFNADPEFYAYVESKNVNIFSFKKKDMIKVNELSAEWIAKQEAEKIETTFKDQDGGTGESGESGESKKDINLRETLDETRARIKKRNASIIETKQKLTVTFVPLLDSIDEHINNQKTSWDERAFQDNWRDQRNDDNDVALYLNEPELDESFKDIDNNLIEHTINKDDVDNEAWYFWIKAMLGLKERTNDDWLYSHNHTVRGFFGNINILEDDAVVSLSPITMAVVPYEFKAYIEDFDFPCRVIDPEMVDIRTRKPDEYAGILVDGRYSKIHDNVIFDKNYSIKEFPLDNHTKITYWGPHKETDFTKEPVLFWLVKSHLHIYDVPFKFHKLHRDSEKKYLEIITYTEDLYKNIDYYFLWYGMEYEPTHYFPFEWVENWEEVKSIRKEYNEDLKKLRIEERYKEIVNSYSADMSDWDDFGKESRLVSFSYKDIFWEPISLPERVSFFSKKNLYNNIYYLIDWLGIKTVDYKEQQYRRHLDCTGGSPEFVFGFRSSSDLDEDEGVFFDICLFYHMFWFNYWYGFSLYDFFRFSDINLGQTGQYTNYGLAPLDILFNDSIKNTFLYQNRYYDYLFFDTHYDPYIPDLIHYKWDNIETIWDAWDEFRDFWKQ